MLTTARVGELRVNATGLRSALWRGDLGAELPLLAVLRPSVSDPQQTVVIPLSTDRFALKPAVRRTGREEHAWVRLTYAQLEATLLNRRHPADHDLRALDDRRPCQRPERICLRISEPVTEAGIRFEDCLSCRCRLREIRLHAQPGCHFADHRRGLLIVIGRIEPGQIRNEFLVHELLRHERNPVVPSWGPFLEIAHSERDAEFEGHVESAEVVSALALVSGEIVDGVLRFHQPSRDANDTRIGLAFGLTRTARREAAGGNRQNDGVKEGLEVIVERAVDEDRLLVCRRHGIT